MAIELMIKTTIVFNLFYSLESQVSRPTRSNKKSILVDYNRPFHVCFLFIFENKEKHNNGNSDIDMASIFNFSSCTFEIVSGYKGV